MIKKFLILTLMLMWTANATAKSGLNIFSYPRMVSETAIYTPGGQALKLTDFKGDFVLVVFWSRYCAPCIKELDDLNAFVKQTRDNGIKVLLVSKDDEWSSVAEQKELLKKYGALDIDFYTDREGKLAGDFGIFASPHTVLINKSGEEIGRISGSVDWDDEDVIEYIYKIKAQHG